MLQFQTSFVTPLVTQNSVVYLNALCCEGMAVFVLDMKEICRRNSIKFFHQKPSIPEPLSIQMCRIFFSEKLLIFSAYTHK